MPGVSGMEVCRTLRKTHGFDKLPVIFLSAKNQVADLAEGFALGANDYLSKPFSREELLTRVRYHMDFHLQVETASRRLSALKAFCGDLGNFKGKDTLARAIHALLAVQVTSAHFIVFKNGEPLVGAPASGLLLL